MKKIKSWKVIVLAGWAAVAAASAAMSQSRGRIVDPADMDVSVRPGDDFYRYANGRWLDKIVIPDDQASLRTKDLVNQGAQREVDALLEKILAMDTAPPGSGEQKIRDFLRTGLDFQGVDTTGVRPLKEELDRIEAIRTKADLLDVLAILQALNMPALFSAVSRIDLMNSAAYVLTLEESRLCLSEKSRYSADDEKSAHLRAEYEKHVARMFQLLGMDEAAAASGAASALRLETRLAATLMTPAERRNRQARYNKMDQAGLAALAPAVDWDRYFRNLGVRPSAIVVANVAYLREAGRMISDVPLDDWRAFLRWMLINGLADYISEDFARRNFEFYGRTLNSLPSLKPRRERVFEVVGQGMGEILGRLYVREYFPPAAKERAERIFARMKAALGERIEKLTWMGAATKTAALEKLQAMRIKIGYPEAWQDDTGLNIQPDGFLLNIKRLLRYMYRSSLSNLSRPVDKNGWYNALLPQQAVAGYVPQANEIIFTAAILRPPFFHPQADDAENYGALGFAIGHEMIHGFDDQGRRIDKDGNLRNWWTPEDEAEFKKRSQLIMDQYAMFATPEGQRLNGPLNLGENIADFGALTIALAAYRESLAGKTPPPIEGLTHEQRFFLAFTRVLRGKIRPEALRRMVQEDRHPWEEFRVNGAPFNIPDFYRIFDIRPGDRLYRSEAQRPVIW